MTGAIGGAGFDPNVGAGEDAAAPAEEAPASAPAPDLRDSGARMAAVASVQGQMPAESAAAELEQKLYAQNPDELTQTLAAAKKDDPVAYRTALREFFGKTVGDVSPLKLHMMAMDRNNDGSLTFDEAYKTMRGEGFSPLRAGALSALTAGVLGPITSGKPSFEVNVDKADKTARPFFNTAFNTPAALEAHLDDIMAYDKEKKGYVTLGDVDRMVDDRTAKMNPVAGAAMNYLNRGEWQGLFSQMGGQMTRDELRDFYKGSLFFSFLEPDNLAGKIVAYRSGKIP